MTADKPYKQREFDKIAQVIEMTGGITLSQLSEISGLEASTIQNWVKRGWVESPKNRRYGEQSVARVLVISMLRGAMQLSSIVELMTYVNGKVDDRSDNAIPDGELYSILCSITKNLAETPYYANDVVIQMIDDEMKGYKEPFSGGYQKLRNTLRIMTMAYISSELKNQAEQLFNSIIKNEEE